MVAPFTLRLRLLIRWDDEAKPESTLRTNAIRTSKFLKKPKFAAASAR
jgi:hypothetical protein